MKQALVNNNSIRQLVLYQLVEGGLTTALEVATALDIDESEVIALMNDEEFYEQVCSRSIANLRLAYHSVGVPNLLEKVKDKNDKDFIPAFDRTAKLIGAIKNQDNVTVKLSLENLLSEAKKLSLPVESEAIEVKLNGNIFEAEGEEEIEDEDELEWDEGEI